jgi:hypothetical protein
MSINLSQEMIVTLSRAGQYIPVLRGRKRPHSATLYRWAQRGLRGVRLETIRIGGTLCTSAEAIQRFCDRLSMDVRTSDGASDADGRREASRAANCLKQYGI